MAALRILVRLSAYAAAGLLALVWSAAAAQALVQGIATVDGGASGRAVSALLGLEGAGRLALARMLVGIDLALGLVLWGAIATAAAEWLRGVASDDAVLDVALLCSALASATAGLPAIWDGAGAPLQAMMGELLLCVIAHALAAYGRALRPRQEAARLAIPYALPVRFGPRHA